jgi:hypothetical protein
MTILYSSAHTKSQPEDPWLALASAVVISAAKEVTRRNRRAAEAAAWLASDDAAIYAEVLGIDPAVIKRWLKQRPTKPAKAGQTLSGILRQALVAWIDSLAHEFLEEQ